MPSTELSRRQLLAASGCLSAAIAGCTGVGESETTNHTVTEGGDPLPSDEYESLTLRSDDEEFFVDTGGDSPEDDGRSLPYERSVEFVLTEDEAAELRIDATDAADARTFLEETDFETESVVIEQRSIDDCYRRHVLSVQANPDEFRTQYCRSLKEPTTHCEADRTVVEAIFFRVDRAYDEAPSSRASSESASCPGSGPAVTDDRAAESDATEGDE